MNAFYRAYEFESIALEKKKNFKHLYKIF